MNTMTDDFTLPDNVTPLEGFQIACGHLGLLGVNPETDAIKQLMRSGIRMWYFHDGAIRCVSRFSDHSDSWGSDTTKTPERMVKTLSASDDENVSIVDKETFNWLHSILEDENRVHDGLLWGVTVHCGYGIERGKTPSSQTVKCVPGVGDKLSAKICQAMYDSDNPFVESEPESETGSDE